MQYADTHTQSTCLESGNRIFRVFREIHILVTNGHIRKEEEEENCKYKQGRILVRKEREKPDSILHYTKELHSIYKLLKLLSTLTQ